MSAFLLALCGLLHGLSVRPVLVTTFCKGGILFGASAWPPLPPKRLRLWLLLSVCGRSDFFSYLKRGHGLRVLSFTRQLRVRLRFLLREGYRGAGSGTLVPTLALLGEECSWDHDCISLAFSPGNLADTHFLNGLLLLPAVHHGDWRALWAA